MGSLANFFHNRSARADKDKNGRGEEAANKLLMREKERREVNVIIPKQAIPDNKKGLDWLDCIGELAATL